MRETLQEIERIWDVGGANRAEAIRLFKELAATKAEHPLQFAVVAAATAECVLRTAESGTAEGWVARASAALGASPPPRPLAWVRRAQAMVAVGLGRHDAAQKFAMEACGHAERGGDPFLQAKCSHGLGMVLSTAGMLEEALDASFDARRSYLAAGRAVPGGLENNIAILLSDLDYLDRAAEHADRCVKRAAREGKRVEQASALVTRGWAAYRDGRPEDAVADYLEGLEVARTNGNVQTLQVLNINLGSAYVALGRAEEARAAFDAVEALLPARPSRWLRAATDLESAALLDDEAAAQALASARDEFDRIGRAAEAAQAAERLYLLARRCAHWKDALEHHEDWMRRRDELAASRRRRRSRATELRIEQELAGEVDRDASGALEEVVRDLQAVGEDLRARNRELEALATMDPLTGLANRRGFDQRLEAELARRSGPLSLAVVDVDHFKTVNDTFGHAVGDAVLVRVAATLGKGRRVADLVARRGGDEFVLLLPGADARAARSVARRVVEQVRTEDWESLGAGLQVTLSVGVAGAAVGQGADALFAAADAALYLAKEAGRDRVS